MRAVVIAGVVMGLWECSAAPGTVVESEAMEAAAKENAPPLITMVLGPSEANANEHGMYQLGFAIAFTDDAERVAAFRFESNAAKMDDAPMATGAPNELTSIAVTLPRGTAKGTLRFTLRLISESGVVSAPYADTIFLE